MRVNLIHMRPERQILFTFSPSPIDSEAPTSVFYDMFYIDGFVLEFLGIESYKNGRIQPKYQTDIYKKVKDAFRILSFEQ